MSHVHNVKETMATPTLEQLALALQCQSTPVQCSIADHIIIGVTTTKCTLEHFCKERTCQGNGSVNNVTQSISKKQAWQSQHKKKLCRMQKINITLLHNAGSQVRTSTKPTFYNVSCSHTMKEKTEVSSLSSPLPCYIG